MKITLIRHIYLKKNLIYNKISQNKAAKFENFNFGCGLVKEKYRKIFKKLIIKLNK